MDLKKISNLMRKFREERDWDQFHTPQNLAISLVLEASEVLEHFQWTKTEQSIARVSERRTGLEEELADVAMYLIELAELAEVDLEQAIIKKLERNAEKYPAEASRGHARKYSEF